MRVMRHASMLLLVVPLLVQAGCATAPPAGGAATPPGAGGSSGGSSGGRATMRRATPMGVGVRVASYARWNEQCGQAGLPVAAVTQAPSHGVLVARPTSVTIGSRRFSGATDCRDREIPGVELFYTPEPGFRGTDAMGYQVSEDGTAIGFKATVDVR